MSGETVSQQEVFLFAGFGGQGVMFAGQLLAYAAMDEGYHVTWIPSYGPEMRGGTAHCYVTISTEWIGAPITSQPDVLVAFNNPSLVKYEKIVAPGGFVAYDSSLVGQHPQREDITALAIPATQLAEALGDRRVANVVMLGAVLAVRPVLPPDAIARALEAHLPAQHRSKLNLNYEALEAGKAALTRASTPQAF